MLPNFNKVRNFHFTFGVDSFKGTYAELLALMARRHALLQEEFLEGQEALMDALASADQMTHKKFVEIVDSYLDSLADVLYIAYGTLDLMGVDADDIFEEVHCSNMSKLGENGPIKDPETGKIKKGPNYSPPDLTIFVDAVMSNITNRVK